MNEIIEKWLMKIDGGNPATRTEPGKGKGLHTGSTPDIKNFPPFGTGGMNE